LLIPWQPDAKSPSGISRVLQPGRTDVEEKRVQASDLASVQEGGSAAGELARPSAHVRFALGDAWGGDEGGAGAARHATIEMTMRYAHLSPDVPRQAVKLLDGLGSSAEPWRQAGDNARVGT
jgi:hypothetical protein